MKERRFNLAFLSVKSNILFPQDGFLFPRDRDAVNKRAKRILKKLRSQKLMRISKTQKRRTKERAIQTKEHKLN